VRNTLESGNTAPGPKAESGAPAASSQVVRQAAGGAVRGFSPSQRSSGQSGPGEGSESPSGHGGGERQSSQCCHWYWHWRHQGRRGREFGRLSRCRVGQLSICSPLSAALCCPPHRLSLGGSESGPGLRPRAWARVKLSLPDSGVTRDSDRDLRIRVPVLLRLRAMHWQGEASSLLTGKARCLESPAAAHNGCSASRHGLRVTICPSRAVTIGSGLVDMICTSRLGDLTAGISDPCK
jgi:hypothetical protein